MAIRKRIGVDLYANAATFESGCRRADAALAQSRSRWNNSLNQASRSFNTFSGHVQKSVSSVVDLKTQLGGLATAAAGAFSLQKISQYSDQWKNLTARMNLVTSGMAQTARVQEELFAVAQKTGTPLENNLDAYIRLGNALGETGRQQYDLVRVTDLMSKTLAISGANAQGAATFFTQFGQAAQSDFKAIGQELQTFADQNPRFFQALQNMAAQSGKSLKKMAADGELSTERIIKALMASSDAIDAEAASLPLTLGRALTQLDSAFLKFIGQSDAIAKGTTTLGLAISLLADNLESVATVATVVGAIFAGRLLVALGAQLAVWVANTRQIVLYQVAMARMATIIAPTVAGTVALTGATAALSRAMALVGGPVGALVLGTWAAYEAFKALREETPIVTAAQEAHNTAVAKLESLTQEYVIASAERRKAIKQETEELLANAKSQLSAYLAMANSFNSMNQLQRGAWRIRGWVDPGTVNVDEMEKLAEKNAKLISDAEAMLNGGFDEAARRAGGGGGGGGSGKKKKDVYAEIMKDLERENQQAKIAIDLYGKKESAINRARKELEINNKLAEAGIKLDEKQRQGLEAHLDQLESQAQKYDELETQQKKLEEAEKARQQAITDLGYTFESAFEKAVLEGEKLSDVLNSLLQDILKLTLRMSITEPISRYITSSISNSKSSGGGFLDGIFDAVSGLVPSFDKGTGYVPKDMLANIHQGEAIIPADEVASLGAGRTAPKVTIINNSPSKISTSSRGNGEDLTVIVDELTAANLARPGSKTSKTLQAMNQQTLRKR